jgi:hypothetical protein
MLALRSLYASGKSKIADPSLHRAFNIFQIFASRIKYLSNLHVERETAQIQVTISKNRINSSQEIFHPPSTTDHPSSLHRLPLMNQPDQLRVLLHHSIEPRVLLEQDIRHNPTVYSASPVVDVTPIIWLQVELLSFCLANCVDVFLRYLVQVRLWSDINTVLVSVVIIRLYVPT